MKLLLAVAAALALAGCAKPCPLGCANDSECPQGVAYCFDQITCLPSCISCGATCVRTLHDNCGACGHSCGATEVCVSASSCEPSCPSGQTPCDGACTEPAKDPFNCGACGNKCGRGQVCAASVCTNIDTCS